MNKELIEKLKIKYYVRAFGLMLPEEQECFKEVGERNCLFYTNLNQWSGQEHGFANSVTYAIKPDYQPEPEFQDVEITRQGNWLGITRPWAEDYPHFPFDFTHLHCLPSLPKFKDFWYVTEQGNNWYFTNDGQVATYIDEGKTVYVRFRK